MFRSQIPAEQFYVLGCLHYNHKNICRGTSSWEDKKSTRDFDTLEDMNEALINSINNTVPNDAWLFLLGDVIFGDKLLLEDVLKQIKVKHICNIFGNHCQWMRNKPEILRLFAWTGDYLEVFVRDGCRKKLCCMFHYPMKVWNESHRRSYALTSHSHGSLPYTDDEIGLDCGWDVWKKPLSFKDVDLILSKRRFVAKDHHNSNTF